MHHTNHNTCAVPGRRCSVPLALLTALLGSVALLPSMAPLRAGETDPSRETLEVEAWRAQRARSLTSDDGWLTLAGLFWLKPGTNTFGRDSTNTLRLDNPSLAPRAGAFLLKDGKVRFQAGAHSHVTHAGIPVTSLDLRADTDGEATVLESGALRFFVIQRAGNLGVRVRDLDNAHRREFSGLDYFPVSTEWVIAARFEPYPADRKIPIVNILGMQEDVASPGAVVFERDGRQWRLDTVQEQPGSPELEIMFADGTSGHETYGGGRFLYIPAPVDGVARLDFNLAYNPPCALNDFATCPLPPPQNRLALRVTAGEKVPAAAGGHHP